MKEKKPKSPILVFTAIMFLAMFIILPPLFRSLFPKEEIINEPDVNRGLMSCEVVSVNEGMKISFRANYENGFAVKNIITYELYTPTSEDIAKYSVYQPSGSVTDEINVFKGMLDVEVEETPEKTVVVITSDDVTNNLETSVLSNYMLDLDLAYSTYTGQGYACVKTEF